MDFEQTIAIFWFLKCSEVFLTSPSKISLVWYFDFGLDGVMKLLTSLESFLFKNGLKAPYLFFFLQTAAEVKKQRKYPKNLYFHTFTGDSVWRRLFFSSSGNSSFLLSFEICHYIIEWISILKYVLTVISWSSELSVCSQTF